MRDKIYNTHRTPMSTKVEATIEDLYKVEGKAELVNGEIVEMPLTGYLPHYAAQEIMISLRSYVKRTRTGYAIGDNVGFVVNLPHRKSFCPDARFMLARTWVKFFNGAPVFAVEVRSENDYGPRAERQMAKETCRLFCRRNARCLGCRHIERRRGARLPRE